MHTHTRAHAHTIREMDMSQDMLDTFQRKSCKSIYSSSEFSVEAALLFHQPTTPPSGYFLSRAHCFYLLLTGHGGSMILMGQVLFSRIKPIRSIIFCASFFLPPWFEFLGPFLSCIFTHTHTHTHTPPFSVLGTIP